MNINNFNEKLRRYADGTASDAERAVIEAWYRSYEDGKEIPLTPEHTEQAIRHKIQQATRAPRRNQFFWFRVAASIILAIGGSWFGYRLLKGSGNESYTYVTTAAGELKKVKLPDGSVMWVNAMSHIRVSDNFDGEMRKVYVDDGEAFFEVVHKEKQPFLVNVAGLKVQVLGTSFNINAYKGLPNIKVGVATGKVAVSANKGLLAMLTPGKGLAYNRKSHRHFQHNFNINESLGWRDGRTYLNQASFADLATVVKNLYSIKLKPANEKVNSYQFTLLLQRGMQPDEVLKTISMIHNTHYRKEGDEVVLY